MTLLYVCCIALVCCICGFDCAEFVLYDCALCVLHACAECELQARAEADTWGQQLLAAEAKLSGLEKSGTGMLKAELEEAEAKLGHTHREAPRE